jgi:hypothetical protein
MDALLAPIALAIVLSKTQAIWAAIGVVVLVVIAWKFLKFAFKIGIVVAAAILIFMALRWAAIV